MKKFRLIFTALLLVCLISALTGTGHTRAARVLTFDRAVQINDYQVVLEFSEPVAINLNGSNSGPFVAIRMVHNDEKNNIARSGLPDNDVYLQWTGSLEYVDAKRDRLLFTLTDTRLGVATVTDIMKYRGLLSSLTEYPVRMCVEEVPFSESAPAANGRIDNITTLDGEVYLWPDRPMGQEGAHAPIEVNLNYEIDLSATVSIDNKPVAVGVGLGTDTGPDGLNVETVVKNDPKVIALWLGGSAIVCLAAVMVTALICRRKGRKSV